MRKILDLLMLVSLFCLYIILKYSVICCLGKLSKKMFAYFAYRELLKILLCAI